MLDLIYSIWDAIYPHLPLIITTVVTVGLTIRLGVAYLIREFARLRSRSSRQHFKAKSVLLAHSGLTELYAPAKLHTVQVDEADEDKKPMRLAWLSPYPRAVKASFKNNRVPKSERLNAKSQIREAAKFITVSPLPDSLGGIGEADEHYLITLKLDGKDPDTFRRMTARLAGQLGLHSLEEVELADPYSISFIAHETEAQDPLVNQKAGLEFFEQNPARKPYSLPLAIKKDGTPWSLPTHHTLIFGMTGSGKGSPIHGLIRQLTPFIDAGVCQLYGIDPKASELRPYENTSLFKDIAYETQDSQELIAQLHRMMKRRGKEKTVNLETAELGRSLDATRKTPMIVLVVDELLSLLIALKAMGKSGAGTTTLLTEILAQGRSLGIFIIGATQAADTELLGRMRVNFANTIILRQESAYFNDMFLGEKAKEHGFDSTAIPLSNKANGYAYAGIGYVKEEGGNPVKVRFAYSSDRDIADLCQTHPRNNLPALGSTSTTVKHHSDELTDWSLPNIDDL